MMMILPVRWLRIFFLGFCFLFGAGTRASERTQIAASGTSRVQLVELYSSESCSSCPPADQWVSELRDVPGLWKRFVPVVFHVDYWNHLGWKDELSSDLMTKRQVAISNLWPEPSVYTPAVVVDGKEWRDWRRVRNHALPEAAHSLEIALTLYKSRDGTYGVKVEGPITKRRMVIRIAELGMGIDSTVTRGENSGKVLKHNFVILSWDAKLLGKNQTEETFKLKPSSVQAPKKAIAAWVEEEGNLTPLQAVGAYL